MRIAGYILAVVIGLAALIAGFAGSATAPHASAPGLFWVAGFGLGFLVVSIWRIVVGGQARVEGKDDAIFAILEMPIWPQGVISIAIIAGGILVVFVIFKITGWL